MALEGYTRTNRTGGINRSQRSFASIPHQKRNIATPATILRARFVSKLNRPPNG